MIKQNKLAVFAHIEDAFVPAGLLTLHEESTFVVTSEFSYGNKYLMRPQALEVDPVSLSISDKAAIRNKRILPVGDLKMFGGVRDAAPDAWGRRVIEAKLKVSANDLPESTYLLEAGGNRIGALDVRVSIDAPPSEGHQSVADLQYLLEAAERIEEGAEVPTKLEAIFEAGASLGGARPKATVRDESGALWLAKFQSRHERLNVPEIEAATMRLAKECGMAVPDVQLIQVGDRDVMMIRRFDRYWNPPDGQHSSLVEAYGAQPSKHFLERRLHFVSGLTLLACDEAQSREKSYGELAQGIRRYCHHSVIRENNRELFARMVYNIFVSNDDDHPRNHGFLWDPYIKGWRLSPLYDVMPRPAVGTERLLFLGVGQDGRAANLDNALSAKEMFNLSQQDATSIIEGIWEKVREWRTYFDGFGTSTKSIDQATNAFRHIDVISSRKLRAMLS